ncbi:MAG: MAPEG family protein [Pseudomonadota bacterium]
MTPELLVLLLAVLLAAIQLVLYAVPANLELEPGYTAGPRDGPPKRQLSVRTLRLKRAYDNHIETLPWFAIAVLVAHITGATDTVTTAAAWIYLAARLVYVPLYVIGVFGLRSIVWAIAFFAILTIVVRTLL